jgi:hypothetical protein
MKVTIDFGIGGQNLELKQKMAVAMSIKKTTPTNLKVNHPCIISGLS